MLIILFNIKSFVHAEMVSSIVHRNNIISMQLNDFKYCDLKLIIHLYVVKWFQILLCNTNNSIFAPS